jgi:hypothetical protein
VAAWAAVECHELVQVCAVFQTELRFNTTLLFALYRLRFHQAEMAASKVHGDYLFAACRLCADKITFLRGDLEQDGMTMP